MDCQLFGISSEHDFTSWSLNDDAQGGDDESADEEEFDPSAKTLIDWERQWAESACTHNGIEKTILAAYASRTRHRCDIQAAGFRSVLHHRQRDVSRLC
jgi:hypothetical protein